MSSRRFAKQYLCIFFVYFLLNLPCHVLLLASSLRFIFFLLCISSMFPSAIKSPRNGFLQLHLFPHRPVVCFDYVLSRPLRQGSLVAQAWQRA